MGGRMADGRAQKICRELIMAGASRRKIDAGVFFTDHSSQVPQKKMIPGTAGDGVFQLQECYAQAIKEAEKDMLAYGGLLRTCNLEPEGGACPLLARFKQKIDGEGELGKFKREIPWLFTDFDPSTKEDDGIFARIMEKVSAGIESTGLACVAPDWQIVLARRLELLLTARADKGGFGMKAISPSTPEEPTINTTEQNAVRALVAGFGDCSEFGWELYGLSVLAGPLLNTKIITDAAFASDDDGHIWVGFEFYAGKGGELIVADSAGKEDSVRALCANEAEITPLQFLATYYNNMGLKLPPNISADAGFNYSKRMFETALRYDPSDPQAHYNLGNLYFDKGLYDDAEREYERAIALNGRYANAYCNLALVYKKRGRTGAALDARGDCLKHDKGD